MSLAKKAQYIDQEIDLEGFNVPNLEDALQRGTYADPLPVLPEGLADPKPAPADPIEAEPMLESSPADDMMLKDEGGEAKFEGEVIIEVPGEEDQKEEFSFTLPLCPGSDDEEEFEPADINVTEEDDKVEMDSDPWDWGSPGNYLSWLSKMLGGIPRHSGREVSGVERVIGYMEEILKTFPKAMRTDKNGVIDLAQAEKARDEVYRGLERLHERLEKLQVNKYPRYNKKQKKKSEVDPSLVKEAQKSTHVGGIIVTVPLLISGICRTAINSMVSAGKDIEDVFDKLAKKYDLSPREEFEAMQLLADMGYPVRRPRGTDRDEEVDSTSTDNNDWIANYPG